MKKEEMRAEIVNGLHEIDALINKTENQLAQYIKDNFNGEIIFTDETGYPIFKDDNDSCTESVAAVMINDNNEILFNTDMREVEDGKWEIDECEWFRPRDYGEFDIFNLADVVLSI